MQLQTDMLTVVLPVATHPGARETSPGVLLRAGESRQAGGHAQ